MVTNNAFEIFWQMVLKNHEEFPKLVQQSNGNVVPFDIVLGTLHCSWTLFTAKERREKDTFFETDPNDFL